MKKELTIEKESPLPFSIKRRLKSFQYAFEGLHLFFSTQHNAIVHLAMTVVAFLAAVFFNVSEMEIISLIIVAAFVWTAELFNTAIEKLADVVSKEERPEIKFLKDVAAAAVLLAAIAAFLTGAIIFLPKIFA